MKTDIKRVLLVYTLVFFVLPMMSQDWMEIHFKDGTYRKFCLENVTEIVPTRYDSEGNVHSDYDYQRIETIDDTFVYPLSDVDSISFSKYNEEIAKQNFSNVVDGFFDIINKRESITDVKDIIDDIKNVEGVSDAWGDGHVLYVKVDGLDVVPFHFSHKQNNNSVTKTRMMDDHKASESTRSSSNYIKPDDRQLRVVIANQTHYDDVFKGNIDNYNRLQTYFGNCNIVTNYLKRPTLDFFYNNSPRPDDPNSLTMYEYDIIILDTHGGYDEKTNTHALLTGEVLGRRSVKDFPTEDDVYESDLTDVIDNLNNIRKKYNCEKDGYISFSVHEERYDYGETFIKKWVAYPYVKEDFFKYRAKGNFVNDNSILFNCACMSLKGNETHTTYSSEKKVSANYSLANVFIDKNLGTYIGYNETNGISPYTACCLFYYMMEGLSLDKACYSLSDKSKSQPVGLVKEDNEDGYGGYSYLGRAYLMRVPDLSNKQAGNKYIVPVHTKQISEDDVKSYYSKNQTVKVSGDAALIEYEEDLFETGFKLYYYDPSENSRYIMAEIVPKSIKDKVEFSAVFDNLVPGRKYGYCAYTYDGMNYNYGNNCTFTVPDRIEQVVPDEIRKKMDPYIPIYDGDNPPSIEGVYVMDSPEVVYDTTNNYKQGTTGFVPIYMKFSNQNKTTNTLDYEGCEVSSKGVLMSESHGPGAFISGEGDHFSVFFSTTGVDHYDKYDISVKTSLVISGTKTDSGIKDIRYAFVLKEKGSDPDEIIIPEGSFRVFKDSDDLAKKTSWPNKTRDRDFDIEDDIIITSRSIYSVRNNDSDE